MGKGGSHMRPYLANRADGLFINVALAVLSFTVCAANANQLGSLTMVTYATHPAKL
jgi:hypothetical protein